MNNYKLEIKLEFIPGLKDVVLDEINQNLNLSVTEKKENFVYLNFIENISLIKELRSILRGYIVTQNISYNPHYVSKHKSIIGNIISIINKNTKDSFKSFKIICAGSDSPEVRSIADYIQDTYKLIEDEDADLKVHIIKIKNIWEVGVQISKRPLSVREYKIRNMDGAMDPTIAHSLNYLCSLKDFNSYLNIFSGSATLLIEAAHYYPHLKKFVGFDNSKECISLAIQNIREAGLIKTIKLKEEDIFNNPQLGKFDVITSDLPFGMLVSKYEDLEELYQYFIDYCENTLNPGGVLGVYTSNHKMLKKIIKKSNFKITKELKLKLFTSTNTRLYPKILICCYK